MQFYETPFFILGVSICDNRRTIQEKSDIFSIRDIGDVNEYVRLLTNAHKRIQIELRWLLGSDQEEISKISDTYANISRIRNANITNLIKSKSDVSALVEMNQLTAMLPFVKDDNVDGFVFEISRRYDEIQDGFGKLISTLNTYRQTASFPLIDEIELKNALREYLTDINSDLQKRIVALRASSSLNYQILISRISSFGFSPVIDSLIREYELFITRDLCEYENEVHILAQRLGNSLDDDELSARVIDIQQAARKWKEDILPLQKYELTLGIDTVTRDHERAIIIALDDCYNRLFSFGEKAYKYAYSIACSMLDNLPDDGAHTADRNVVLSRIEKLKPIEDKV